MNNMNEVLTTEKKTVKKRLATAVGSLLIHEADMAVRGCNLLLLYEPKFPIELLKEKND